MKLLVKILLGVFLVSVASCCQNKKYDAAINYADSLMVAWQDSAKNAIVLLDELKSERKNMTESQRMHYELIYAKGMNKAFMDFKTDTVMKQVVAYYDKYGSGNEKMQAYYLLGCVYRDLKDSPASLDCYNKAVACADTTSTDCDYDLLAIVYGQIGSVFLDQGMPNNALEALKKTQRNAEKANDVPLVLQAVAYQANAYYRLNDKQKFLELKEKLFHRYMDLNMKQDAALELCCTICEYVNSSNLAKAKRLMTMYETSSGLVDSQGNVSVGNEVYYFTKGNYYLKCHQVDEAVCEYRKLLRDAKSLDDKEKAYRGLTKAYQTTCQKDSMSKYAILALTAKDTLTHEMATATLIKMQSLYNYDQVERKARQLMVTNSYLKYVGGCVLLILLLGIVITAVLLRQRQIRNVLKEKEKEEQIHLQLIEYLRDNQNLKDKIKKLETPPSLQMCVQVNDMLLKSPIRISLEKKAIKGMLASSEELEDMKKVLGKLTPTYYTKVCCTNGLSEKQIAVCLLVRFFFSSSDLQHLLGISSGYATNVKRNLSKKLFDEELSPKEFEDKIHKLI